MAVQGNMVWFDRALLKVGDSGPINMLTDTIKAVLCTSVQAIARGFVGASADARYADLTAELTTASGYTAGGATLTTLAETRVGTDHVKWTADPIAWTLSAPITFKYMILYSFTATNKDLLGYCDMDTGGGSVSPAAGPIAINPDASLGYLYRYQP